MLLQQEGAKSQRLVLTSASSLHVGFCTFDSRDFSVFVCVFLFCLLSLVGGFDVVFYCDC